MEHDDKKQPSSFLSGMTRRDFLTSVGAGTLGATIVLPNLGSASEKTTGNLLKLTVNGRTYQLTVEPRWTLLHVLREKLGLTGTKPGCERGECGACTVLIDGETRYSCMTLALEASDKQVVTIEGLMQGEELGTVQQAFVEEDGFQCGYCTSGQIVAAEGLLRKHPKPAIGEIRLGMSGNLCRCGAYDHIFKSVRRASELRK